MVKDDIGVHTYRDDHLALWSPPGRLETGRFDGGRGVDGAAFGRKTARLSAVRASGWFGSGAVAGVAALLAACGSNPPPAAREAARASSSGTAAERYFPLEDGRLYHYVTNDGGESGMLVARVHRADATHGELRLSNTQKRFVYGPAGVAYEGGATILANPPTEGASWPGEHGGTTTLTSLDVSVTVPAGTFDGCARTVEQGGRVPDAVYTTTYCPDVGMVLLEVRAADAVARAELKSYGAPVDLQ